MLRITITGEDETGCIGPSPESLERLTGFIADHLHALRERGAFRGSFDVTALHANGEQHSIVRLRGKR